MKIDTPQVLVAALALMGGLLAFHNLDLPLVRNSLVYAKIAYAITDHGLLASAQHAYNKALGFSVLSWPLVAWFGANAGLKIASFIGTVLFMAVVPVFLKRLPGMDDKGQSEFLKTVLVLTLFNPLVAYQFMSAYPDAFFAALTLGAIVFLDRMLSKDAGYLDAPAFAALALAAVWV
ncbi:MAG TPA: hypothetical protein ENI79_02785, partial [Rhodospirillales bacterium]|nr:hypothetical protein [Rhodospirillales bacterium]